MTVAVLLLAAIDFSRQIAPLLEKTCVGCHNVDRALAGLRLDTSTGAQRVITPGQPDRSALYLRTQLASDKPGAMPPGGPPLSAAEAKALRQWIAEGANWPAGITLKARASRTAPDDLALTRQLHARIAAQPVPEFKAYRQVIPSTDVAYEMAAIPGGEFTMGSPEKEEGRKKDEGPQRRVKIEPFWMGKTEVTWDEYRVFMFHKALGDESVDAVSRPTRPYVEMSFGMGINGYPAISMTQHAASKYAQWLSARTGHFYRLPTEAEWEYACRAGSSTAYSFGDDPAQLASHGWFADTSNGKYQQVGKKKPNAWGLHDMHGNVMEWTLDQYLPDYAKAGAEAWVKSTKPYPHVARGGSWNDDATLCRCAARVASDPSWKMQDPQLPKSIWYLTDAQWLGFRLVRPQRAPSAEQMHASWNNGVEKE